MPEYPVREKSCFRSRKGEKVEREVHFIFSRKYDPDNKRRTEKRQTGSNGS